MSDELMLSGSLDQSLKTDSDWVFKQIDKRIAESVEQRLSLIHI